MAASASAMSLSADAFEFSSGMELALRSASVGSRATRSGSYFAIATARRDLARHWPESRRKHRGTQANNETKHAG